MKTALTIAGSDSGGGAGIQADLKTFESHGVYGVCAVTAITAQNTLAVSAVHSIPVDVVVAQLEAVAHDIGVHAAKTGMLATREIVEAVSSCIRDLAIPSVVVDPVIFSTRGSQLLDANALDTVKARLLPTACCVTPNRPEAEALAGCSIESIADAREAARRIVDLGARAVVVTGGHLPTADVVDVLFDGRDYIELSGPRLDCEITHGTGCTFSAAMTAGLARGWSLADSARAAKSYVSQAMRRGISVGAGSPVLQHSSCRTRRRLSPS